MRNNFSGLEDFIRRWDSGSVPDPNLSYQEMVEMTCRDKIAGDLAQSKAKIYTRWDNEFRNAIEPGVRQLVLRLIDQYNCITYSSCEGHPVTPDGEFSFRHVGLIPRTTIEYRFLLRVLSRLADDTNRKMEGRQAAVIIAQRDLRSADLVMPCLEIRFVPVEPNATNYFLDLEGVYSVLLLFLSEQ